MILGGMGDRQTILCRGLGEYVSTEETESYTIDMIVASEHAAFYDLDARINFLRRVRYHLDAYLKVDCSEGYSLDARILTGTPRLTTNRTYSVYKVKVPEYDEST